MSALVDEATVRAWLRNVGRRPAIERLAHSSCGILLRLRAVGLVDEDSDELPLKQTDPADTVGLTTVHVDRSLQELRRRGPIELEHGRSTILVYTHLRALSGFRADSLHLGEQAAA